MAGSPWYAYAFCMLLFVISINCQGTTNAKGGKYDHIIYAGTKWCGIKSIAANETDLGEHQNEDICCRSHHQCSDVIKIGETKYDITNNSDFDMKHCDCDKEFRKCLKGTNTWAAKAIGGLYFNGNKKKCIIKTRPLSCNQWSDSLKSRCVNYVPDETKEEQWQQIDIPLYGDKLNFYV